jgi:hypothetical protein
VSAQPTRDVQESLVQTMNHTFRAIKHGSNRCIRCGGWSDHSEHSIELWSDADRDREAAIAAQEALDMSERMRRSIVTASIDRELPLFLDAL